MSSANPPLPPRPYDPDDYPSDLNPIDYNWYNAIHYGLPPTVDEKYAFNISGKVIIGTLRHEHDCFGRPYYFIEEHPGVVEVDWWGHLDGRKDER